MVAFRGRLDHQKGIDELLTTPSLLARLPHHQLILIGDGPLRGDVEEAVQSSDAVGRAHWIGWQANPRDWMAASQLLLLPARYEGMPNVVLEAMAEGIAVACTRVEGIEEVLGDEAMGQTSKAADFDTWTDLVVRLASDDQLCSDLGVRNQLYATQQHSWNDDYSNTSVCTPKSWIAGRNCESWGEFSSSIAGRDW